LAQNLHFDFNAFFKHKHFRAGSRYHFNKNVWLSAIERRNADRKEFGGISDQTLIEFTGSLQGLPTRYGN